MPFNPIHTERDILLRIAAGDEQAFYELFAAYTPVLRPYFRKSTRSETDTEEILQETFIRIWLYRTQLPEVENLTGWIYTVAARVCFNYLRAALNQQKKHDALEHQKAYASTELNTPLEHTQVAQIRRDLQKAVQQLSESHREVYLLNREQGLKPAAIAEHLGKPVGTVKNQLSAALKDIREYLIAAGHTLTVILYIFLNIF